MRARRVLTSRATTSRNAFPGTRCQVRIGTGIVEIISRIGYRPILQYPGGVDGYRHASK